MSNNSTPRAQRIIGITSYAIVGIGALVLISGLSYVLGQDLLNGNALGNDSPLHIAYAEWLNRYFPSIPHWYPIQGAGVSLLHGYPVLPHMVVVGLARVTDLSILQSYRLITFLTYPLTALGVFLLAWRLFRRITIGLVAGVLYLLAPISWTWTFQWGFLSQTLAIVMLPIGILLFDLYYTTMIENPKSPRRRLWLALLVAVFALTLMLHMMVAAGLLGAMILFVLGAWLFSAKGSRFVNMKQGIWSVFQVGILGGLVLAAYIVPFYLYSQVANEGGFNLAPLHQLNRIPIPQFLGLESINPRLVLTRMANPLVTVLFAIIGGLLAFRMDRKGLALFIAVVIASIYSVIPEISFYLRSLSSSLAMIFGLRSMLVNVMVLLPIAAAFGMWAVARLILSPLTIAKGEYLGSRDSKTIYRDWAASLGMLGLAVIAIFGIGKINQQKPTALAYGPLNDGIDLNNIWNAPEGSQTASLFDLADYENWPEFEINNYDRLIDRSREIAELISEEEPLRIDISPYQGRFAMDLATYANASQINTYTFTTNLIHEAWGYQQNVYYSREDPANEYGNPTSLNNSADWFGTNYVFVDVENDPIEMYEEAGWTLKYEDTNFQIRQNPNPVELAELISRPVILVISKREANGYMNLFRLSNDGLLPFNDVILVEGQENVDDYSLEEMQQFDAVFLHGYDYKNSSKAWNLLEDYVRAGGNIYIETGWEFWVPEWEFELAPEVLPVERLEWTDYGIDPSYQIQFEEIAGQVDTAAFKPLIWEGQPWTLSGAQAEDVRDWGKVILAAADRPLIVAGELGAGRVAWSGMNLMAHAEYLGKNQEELNLLGNIIGWLIQDVTVKANVGNVQVERESPDSVRFVFDDQQTESAWLLWREAYYPNWSAYLSDGSLESQVPIMSAGPGFMLMPVGGIDEAASLELRWELSLYEKGAILTSFFGLLFLGALIIDGLLLEGNGLTWLKIAVLVRIPRPFIGEGKDRDWAERKRRELNSGTQSKSETPSFKVSEAVAWISQSDSEPNESTQIHDSEPSPQREEVTEIADSDAPVEDKLLQSWMQDGGHSEDEWAEKILDRRVASRKAARGD